MSFIVCIPARMQASRFPNKPLARIAGVPMIVRVYQQALLSIASKVVVATDSQAIAKVIEEIGGNVVITKSTHSCGTERIAEVCDILSLSVNEIIVNVQGDEPLIAPENINQVGTILTESDMASLYTALSAQESGNQNIVKVVCDLQNRAMYFSRQAIPTCVHPNTANNIYKRHLGIYAYTVGFLQKFITLPPSPIEQLERLEQLRALEHGYVIQMAEAIMPAGIGVDTIEDVAEVEKIIYSKESAQ